MSNAGDIELQQRPAGASAAGGAAPVPVVEEEKKALASSSSVAVEVAAEEEDAADAPEPGMSTGMIVLLVCLSPLLLVLLVFLGLLWLVLLPFRSCMHRHSTDALEKPSDSALLSEEEAQIGLGGRGEFVESASSGCWLFQRQWLPGNQAPRGIVFVLHGFAEHTGRAGYAALARSLTDAGFIVHALDHQGHGRSTGDRSFFVSLDDLVTDAIDFIKAKNKLHDANIPRLIFGHSMGGLIALTVAEDLTTAPTAAAHADFDLTGLILSSPCLALDPAVAIPPLKMAAKMLSGLLPKLLLDSLPSSEITRNVEAVARYDNDARIFRGGMRTRVAAEFMRLMDLTMHRAPEFTKPVLLLHGTKDKIVPLKASTSCYRVVGSKDKALKKYPEALHELFEDEEFGQTFLQDITRWAADHADAKKANAAAAALAAPAVAAETKAADVVVPIQEEERKEEAKPLQQVEPQASPLASPSAEAPVFHDETSPVVPEPVFVAESPVVAEVPSAVAEAPVVVEVPAAEAAAVEAPVAVEAPAVAEVAAAAAEAPVVASAAEVPAVDAAAEAPAVAAPAQEVAAAASPAEDVAVAAVEQPVPVEEVKQEA